MIPVTHQQNAPSLSRTDQPLIDPGQRTPFVLVTSLFFLWGIPNNLNDVLIGQFMKSFTLSRFEAGLVQSAFYLGYFLLAMPAALLMRKKGYKAGMIAGLVLFGVGAFLFWPAALSMRYGFFLVALFVMAGGLAFLETASNPFITQIGDPSGSERRLNVAQAFNPLGAISGVLLGTIFIFSGIELSPQNIAMSKANHTYDAYLRSETLRVLSPYMALGVLAFALAAVFFFTTFPRISAESKSTEESEGSFSELLTKRRFLLAVATQFMYVGAQVGTWSYFIQYVQVYARQTQKLAGLFLTGTLVAFALGRFSSAWIMQKVPPARLMGIYAAVNVALVALAIGSPGWVGLWAIFLTSFFMSVMFPTIFALGLRGLGGNTKIGGSILVMSIIGGAVLTPVMGLISEIGHSIALAYVVPLIAYVCVALFSFLANGPRALGKSEIIT
ncbi:L-fucose:H+ symporter permease [Tunturiibacter lichenicola]|uniref:L-fucose:H+ symporter permease n=1 Tax=Tunturiibacter lichenicola TaxID=2051959 RepID=UPI0021B194E9|nr:L-fucose:H+ symporter permease [Edaphobacter lichenicola]